MSYFTLGILVDKQADATQSRCFQHLARHPEQVGHKVFKQWLELEGKAAVKQIQKVLAVGYQHMPGPALQQAGAKPQHGKVQVMIGMAPRSLHRKEGHKAGDFF